MLAACAGTDAIDARARARAPSWFLQGPRGGGRLATRATGGGSARDTTHPSTSSHGTVLLAATKSFKSPSSAFFPPKMSPLHTLSPVKTNASGSSSAMRDWKKVVPFLSEQGYFSCAAEMSLQKRLPVSARVGVALRALRSCATAFWRALGPLSALTVDVGHFYELESSVGAEAQRLAPGRGRGGRGEEKGRGRGRREAERGHSLAVGGGAAQASSALGRIEAAISVESIKKKVGGGAAQRWDEAKIRKVTLAKAVCR